MISPSENRSDHFTRQLLILGVVGLGMMAFFGFAIAMVYKAPLRLEAARGEDHLEIETAPEMKAKPAVSTSSP